MTRNRKLQKIIEFRERALEKRAGVLVESQTMLAAEVERAESEAQQLEEAQRQRRALGSTMVGVGDWVEMEQWLRARHVALDQAEQRVAAAETKVDAARQEVLVARLDVRRVEMLDERLQKKEASREERREQKLTDEFSLRASSNSLRQRRD